MDQVIVPNSNQFKIDELNKEKYILYSKLKSQIKNKINNENPHKTEKEKKRIIQQTEGMVIEVFEITTLYDKGRKYIIETIIDDIEEIFREDYHINIIIPRQTLYQMVEKLPYKGIKFMNIYHS